MAELTGLRINKFFTENGICSRREADKLINEGRISIDGKAAKLGDRVQKGQKVSLDGEEIFAGAKRAVVIAYHKPPGIICTMDTRVEHNIVEAVNYPDRVFPIGRLDQFSEGLILLTNMGDIVNKILRAKYKNEKEYIVDLNDTIDDKSIQRMASGIFILGQKTLPCEVVRLGPKRIRMVLTQGLNRQIRRMVEDVGLRVSRLRRVRIMNIELGDLARGECRKLDAKELKVLMRSLENAESRVERSIEEVFPEE